MSHPSQTVSGSRRRVLVLLDTLTATASPDKMTALERTGAILKVIDYRHLMRHAEAIRELLREHQVDFVLFSRNDQVFDRVSIGPFIRALRIGYSTFSGIDPAEALEQTKACLDDYLAGGSELRLHDRTCSPRPEKGQAGTFSLVFDMEQIGCARFGLPRILDLLDQYGVSATFFTTNFISEVYPNVPGILVRRGHEIGLHGQYHEYLGGRPVDLQIDMIRQMKSGFKSAGPIGGANFIGRMDAATVAAMIANGLAYFVVFMEHRYRPFAYRKMPLHPLAVWSPQGVIWMVPISVETYSRPWFAVKNMVDSAHIAGRTEARPHISVLLHPFRDGSLRHIDDLNRLLDYLQGTLGYTSMTLSERVQQLPRWEPSGFICYQLDPSKRAPANGVFWPGWWHDRLRYEQRICNVYQALVRNGRQPALCFNLPAKGDVYAVYPHLPEESAQIHLIEKDPLLFTRNSPDDSLPTASGRKRALYAFVPKSWRNDLRNAVQTSRPRFPQDYTGLIPEAALRLTYRLSPGREIY